MLSNTLAEIPLVGEIYIVDMLPETIPVLLARVCAALCARERFHRDAPAWAPCLPLRYEDCEMLEETDDHRLNLVGYYASSLRGELWDYDGHPSFAAFASGLMAYEHTPDRLRHDRALRHQFPPRPFDGLCDGRLDWRSPEKVASDRHTQAPWAAADARAAGTTPAT